MQSHRLNLTRFRIFVFFAGLIFIILILRLRTGQKSDPPAPADITIVTESSGAEYYHNPLIMTFFPTFENVHLLVSRTALETYLYEIDRTAYVVASDFDILGFLDMDFRLESRPDSNEPRILIFHTHSQEDFIDSRPGEVADTIVGVGALLADILTIEHGIPVLHDTGRYDLVDGILRRTGSYERMAPPISALLDMYPSIEVVIDLHRDGVPDSVHLVKEVNGRPPPA